MPALSSGEVARWQSNGNPAPATAVCANTDNNIAGINMLVPSVAEWAAIGNTNKPSAVEASSTTQRTRTDRVSFLQNCRTHNEPMAIPARYDPKIRANAGARFVATRNARNQ